MREIKFRGLNRPSGTWKYGYLVVDEKYTQIWQEGDVPVPVDPETVGQFIGLHDKNGKGGFEKDITLDEEINARYMIEWEEGGFYLKGIGKDCFGLAVDDLPIQEIKDHEVIGNELENPELLEKPK